MQMVLMIGDGSGTCSMSAGSKTGPAGRPAAGSKTGPIIHINSSAARAGDGEIRARKVHTEIRLDPLFNQDRRLYSRRVPGSTAPPRLTSGGELPPEAGCVTALPHRFTLLWKCPQKGEIRTKLVTGVQLRSFSDSIVEHMFTGCCNTGHAPVKTRNWSQGEPKMSANQNLSTGAQRPISAATSKRQPLREDLGPKQAWPIFSEEEIEAVEAVLRSGKINYWNGTEGREFEKEFARFCGVEHAIALANGTVALELALIALGIGSGDEVIVTPRTFLASASCIVMRGARPVFADVDPVSQNITAETIRRVISDDTKAIIAVHLAGWPCDMDPIMELANERELKVIEDCAQAHGATYKGKAIGSIGHVGAFSFCTDKIMSLGGEGGMLVTNDRDLWQKAWAFKDHGKSFDAVYNKTHPLGFRWLHESFGTNWRLTEMQSAIGRVQLRRLPQTVEARRRNAKVLNEAFADQAALRLTLPPAGIEHAYYKYYVFVRPECLQIGWSRDRILEALIAVDVPGLNGSCSEIYLEKAFDNSSFRPAERLPVARKLGETSFLFLVDPTFDEVEMTKIADAAGRILRLAT